MVKPFSIQAPEEVAKAYGGDKQKIAQAAQMGIVDPTAAVLAGMFIDKMRSAAQTEQAPQQTIAQQVFAPPQPQMPMMGAPAGGLGATPQASPPPIAPQLPMGGDMGGDMGAAPQGMAEGGVAGIDIPDTMFDESSNGGFNDGYAVGGLVAFAGGGMSNLHDSIEYWESGGKQSAVSPKGARGVMQLMPGTSRDPGFGVTPARDDSEGENRRVGREYVDALYRRYGDQATALAAYNWGPGNVDRWLKAGGDPAKLPAETRKYVANVMGGDAPPIRERDIGTAEGRMASLSDIDTYMQNRFGRSAEEQDALNKMRARLQEMGSDEYYEKQRKDSMWETLAQIGFNMASTKSPYVLQAIGEAAAAALPGAKADKKERKALKDRALDGLIELGARDRKEALEKFKIAGDIWKEGINQEQFDKNVQLKESELKIMRDRADAELAAAQSKAADPEKVAVQWMLMYPQGDPRHDSAKSYFDTIHKAPANAQPVDIETLINQSKGAGGQGGSGGNVPPPPPGTQIITQ